MKTIAFFTTSRAEFGALSMLLRKIEQSSGLDYLLFAGGMHLAKEFGETLQEILDSGIRIAGKFDFLLNEDSPESNLKSDGLAIFELSRIFAGYPFDLVCISGDRHEMLAVAMAAILFRKPVVHLHGGEMTLGAMDEQIRHMITKASHLHFVTCEEYALNVRGMGEESWRIHNTGFLAADHMIHSRKIPRREIFDFLALDPRLKTILLTYHPVTNDASVPPEEQLENIFRALEPFDLQVIITSPNNEQGWASIKAVINRYTGKNPRYRYFDSLGIDQYHSLISYAHFVIGNSSSGITEVPFYRIPTINIGKRQSGRVRHDCIIDCEYSEDSIRKAVEKAMSGPFRSSISDMAYKFGGGDAADRMVSILEKIKIDGRLLTKKLITTGK